MPGEPKTSKRRIAAKEKQAEALELRKAGLTYDAIAARLGYTNKTSAYKAVMTALNDLRREPAEEVRRLEVERLDALWQRLWDRLNMAGPLKLSDLGQIIQYALKLSERRAKLLGLDQPMKIAPTDPTGEYEYGGLRDSEVVQAFMELLASRQEAASDSSGDGRAVEMDTSGET